MSRRWIQPRIYATRNGYRGRIIRRPWWYVLAGWLSR